MIDKQRKKKHRYLLLRISDFRFRIFQYNSISYIHFLDKTAALSVPQSAIGNLKSVFLPAFLDQRLDLR